jgi:hypothetical protein
VSVRGISRGLGRSGRAEKNCGVRPRQAGDVTHHAAFVRPGAFDKVLEADDRSRE